MKKFYKCPNEEDIKEGSIVEIYLDYQNKINFEGRAILLEEVVEKINDKTYIREEIYYPSKKNTCLVIYAWKKFKIRFIDGPNKDWVTSRRVSYFHSIKMIPGLS